TRSLPDSIQTGLHRSFARRIDTGLRASTMLVNHDCTLLGVQSRTVGQTGVNAHAHAINPQLTLQLFAIVQRQYHALLIVQSGVVDAGTEVKAHAASLMHGL